MPDDPTARQPRGPRRTRVILVALGIAGAAAGLALWSGGFGSRVGGDDLYGLLLPKYRYAAERLREGHVALWNPYEFCGAPLLGMAQGGTLYPPLLLVNVALTPFTAIQVFYVVHLIALSIFTVLYLTRSGTGLASAAVGASLFLVSVFNGLTALGRDHPNFLPSDALVPAIFLAWDGVLEGRRRSVPFLALALGLQWYPSYPEIPVVTALLLVVVAASSRGWTVGRRIAAATTIGTLGVLIGAAQILPLAEAVAQTERGTAAFGSGLWLFGIYIFPQFIMATVDRYGAAGLSLLLLGILHATRKRAAWTAAFVWSFWALNWPFRYLYLVYPFSGLRDAFGWNHVGPFFGSCLAASGLAALREAVPPRHRWTAPAVMGLVAVVSAAGGRWLEAAVGVGCGLGTIPPLRRRGGWAVPVAFVGLHCAAVMSGIGRGDWPAPDVAALAPRVAILRRLQADLPGSPRILAELEVRRGLVLRERLRSASGYEPALPLRRTSRIAHHLRLNDATFPSRWQILAANPGLAGALGLGIVVVSPAEAGPLLAAGFARVETLPGGDLVLYRRAPPRFHVVHSVVRAADEDDSFRLVTDRAFDPREEAVVEADEPPPVAAADASAPDRVDVLLDAPERIRLTATVSTPSLLVVADSYFPGWEARVDSVPTRIWRANYAFRAVALEAGTHDVELAYRPLSFRLGATLSGLGLAIAAMLLVRGRRRAEGSR